MAEAQCDDPERCSGTRDVKCLTELFEPSFDLRQLRGVEGA